MYAIRCTPHYFAGDIHGRDKEYLVTGLPPHGDGDALVFNTLGEANKFERVLSKHPQTYLDQGQYASPEYRVVPYQGRVRPVSVVAAARQMGYGYDDDGNVLDNSSLRAKIEELLA